MQNLTHDLLRLVGNWTAQVCPGRLPRRLTVEFDDGEVIALPIPLPLPAIAPAQPDVTAPTELPSPRRHGSDFRAVVWDGVRYTFTESQAEVVRVLWESFEAGLWDVGDRALLNAANSESVRLSEVFRDHPAWMTLVVEGQTRGTHRLCDQLPQ